MYRMTEERGLMKKELWKPGGQDKPISISYLDTTNYAQINDLKRVRLEDEPITRNT